MSESKPESCPFCAIAEERVVEATNNAFAILDAYPVSPGHTLIVVRRHVADIFELNKEELAAVVRLIRSARRRIDGELQPAGYNIGANVGRASGQTIAHAHFHVIPRYLGDTPDPSGGVRNVILGKGRYTTDD
jgi:diadenosine tetraphosphate (Ap4A) HIT family hydrolase